MGIPESQLDTWSHQGSIAQSSTTYSIIKNALESSSSGYSGKDFSIFLQGSYSNDTNIFSESDVDIVIRLNSCFYRDLSNLSDDQQAIYEGAHFTASYCYYEFKRDVLAHLQNTYGSLVKPGGKA